METGLSNCRIETRDQETFPRLFEGGTAVNVRSNVARYGVYREIKNYGCRIWGAVQQIAQTQRVPRELTRNRGTAGWHDA